MSIWAVLVEYTSPLDWTVVFDGGICPHVAGEMEYKSPLLGSWLLVEAYVLIGLFWWSINLHCISFDIVHTASSTSINLVRDACLVY